MKTKLTIKFWYNLDGELVYTQIKGLNGHDSIEHLTADNRFPVPKSTKGFSMVISVKTAMSDEEYQTVKDMEQLGYKCKMMILNCDCQFQNGLTWVTPCKELVGINKIVN